MPFYYRKGVRVGNRVLASIGSSRVFGRKLASRPYGAEVGRGRSRAVTSSLIHPGSEYSRDGNSIGLR